MNHLESVYLLFQGNVAEAKNRKHYKQFTSFHELQQYAEHSCDLQLQREIRVRNKSYELLQTLIHTVSLSLTRTHIFFLSSIRCRYASAILISYTLLNKFINRRWKSSASLMSSLALLIRARVSNSITSC